MCKLIWTSVCKYNSFYNIFFFKAGHVASNRPEVNIADQIAIRSLVLSKNLGKVGGQQGMLYL